ncbi:MAG TPA: maleylpyruvate isomerase family mycothiol-dependent enzyme [Mycobacteriales bacterium]|nr:maleylpyruvate isomerase family mycothiol-dependent enzyme [Mycobacteriales bacterium]
MTPEEHVQAIAEHAGRLAAAATDLDAPAPTCPGWTVRDVLGHLGGVHRWAASYVERARTEPPGRDEQLERPPGDAELLDWFRAGHEHLTEVLSKAGDDLECWTFLPAPTPRAFWARRQAHETAMHAVDVLTAAGRSATFGTELAVDGIDELLLGFFARQRGKLLAEPGVTLGVRAVDARPDDAWTMRIGPQGREVDRGDARGDLVVCGPASDIYLLLWNRRGADGLDVTGDEQVLDLWREKARINWS